MPYVAPTSVSTGDVLTAARYNSDVVGNMTDHESRLISQLAAINDTYGFIVTPTSVTNGTANGGEITFSAASSVTVTGCFSSAYDNYKVTILFNASADTTLQMRMRVSGADAATNYGGYGWYYSLGGGTSGALWAQTTGQTSMRISDCSTGKAKCHFTLMAPNLAESTMASGWQYDPSNTDGGYFWGSHTTATAYDSLTIFPGTGTITGTLRIYGLQDA